MKDETNEKPLDEREALEERVLALLLNELNPKEVAAISSILAEDASLRAYRDRLDRSLDFIGEAVRSKGQLEVEDLRLDSHRRRELEELWVERQPGGDESEEENDPVPFEVISENAGRPRKKFFRFLPMVAAAALAFGATGIIVRSVLQQAEHGEDMALAAEDASEVVSESTPMEVVRKPSSGKEADGTLQKIRLRQRQESLSGLDRLQSDAAPFAEPGALALSSDFEVIDAEVIRGPEAIFNDRLANDIEGLNEKLGDEGKLLASDLQPNDSRVIVLDPAGGSGENLDEALDFAEKNNLPTGTVRSFIEANTVDKRTASVSGGASAASAGFQLSRRADASDSPKAPIPGPSVSAPSPFLANRQVAPLDSPSSKKEREALGRSGKAPQLTREDSGPRSESIPDPAAEEESKRSVSVPGRNGESPKPSSVPAKSSPAPVVPNLKERDKDFSNGVIAARPLPVTSPAKLKAKPSSSDEVSPNEPGSIHEPGAHSGAIAGKKGAKRDLVAFAEFGLDVPVAGRVEDDEVERPFEETVILAAADSKAPEVKESFFPTDDAPEKKLTMVNEGEGQPVSATEDDADTHLLSVSNRFALVTGALLVVALFVGFVLFRKRQS